ncbi:MAG: hypothetical protein AB7S38_11945 [Vulcanimicrobiota bacterium]
MTKKWVWLIGGFFVGVPLLIAVMLWLNAREQEKLADYLDLPLTGPVTGEVRVEAKPAADQPVIESRDRQMKCLAYHLRVLVVTEREDSDGDAHEYRSVVFEETQGVDPLVLDCHEKKLFLSLNDWTEHHRAYLRSAEQDPPYLDTEQLPEPDGEFLRYEIEEYPIAPDETLFLAAEAKPGEAGFELRPSVSAGQLVLYPGGQAACVSSYRSRAGFNRVGAFVLLCFSLLAFVVVVVLAQKAPQQAED